MFLKNCSRYYKLYKVAYCIFFLGTKLTGKNEIIDKTVKRHHGQILSVPRRKNLTTNRADQEVSIHSIGAKRPPRMNEWLSCKWRGRVGGGDGTV